MRTISVISFSGGLDSTSLLLHLIDKKHTIYAISFNYGQKHSIELKKASANINYLESRGIKINHKTVNLTDAISLLDSSLTDINQNIPEGYYKEKNMKSTVVPNRNAIFMSFVYAYALSLNKQLKAPIEISLGVHSGDHDIYPDCRIEFYNKIFEAFRLGNWDTERITLYLPYITLNKSEIIKDAINSCNNLNLNLDLIFKNTHTSYNPDDNGISDGKTASDIERVLAFNQLNMKDPIKYQKSWEDIVAHALKVEKSYNQK